MRLPWRSLLAALAGLFLTAALPAPAWAEPYEARVTAPVADLRKEPSEPGPEQDHDPLEESQLLYGDPVRVLEEKDGWARVEAVGQAEWSHHRRWEGYPGWIRLRDLGPDNSSMESTQSTGYKVPGTPVQRAAIVRSAQEFLGTPYYWGGRSPYDPNAKAPPHRGVDCSGLVGLAYQAHGLSLPRDAHEQWMKARKIRRDQLEPADLIFFSDPKDPARITHVMLYADKGRVIEAPGTGQSVRETSLEARVKEAEAAGRQVYYGTYFSGHPELVEG